MAIHVWSVFCSKSSVDRNTNNISLFDVTEQLNLSYEGDLVAGPVMVPGEFDLVSLWLRSNVEKPESPVLRASVIGPNGKTLVGPEHKIDLATAPRSRSILKMNAVPINGNGYHFFLVELRNEGTKVWQEVARIPLDVRLTRVESATTGVAPKE